MQYYKGDYTTVSTRGQVYIGFYLHKVLVAPKVDFGDISLQGRKLGIPVKPGIPWYFVMIMESLPFRPLVFSFSWLWLVDTEIEGHKPGKAHKAYDATQGKGTVVVPEGDSMLALG